MSHTKGKLTIGGLGLESLDWYQHCIFDEQERFFASTETSNKTYEEEAANARRLVVCWNALEGVPTEWLENYVGAGLKNVIQQNSDLIRKEEELSEKLITTEEENAALKAENERLRYLRDNFVRCEPKMDGKHHWIAKGKLIGSGNTFEEAIDAAMKETK